MSRLKINGFAEMSFDTDIFDISITVKAFADTSGSALSDGKAKTEEFLSVMSEKLGISPKSFTLSSDSVNRIYGDNQQYCYTKEMTLRLESDLASVETVTDVLGGMENTEYRISYSLSDTASKEKLVLTEAIKDSRRKAELIAETLGQKITGLEEADFEYAEEIQLMRSAPMLKANSCDSLASQLNNPVQTISKNISMVWISEEK